MNIKRMILSGLLAVGVALTSVAAGAGEVLYSDPARGVTISREGNSFKVVGPGSNVQNISGNGAISTTINGMSININNGVVTVDGYKVYPVTSAPAVSVSGDMVTKEMALNQFSSLGVFSPIRVVLTKAPEYKAKITAPAFAFDNLDLYNGEGNLNFMLDNEVSLREGEEIVAYVTAPTVNELMVSGCGSIETASPLSYDGTVYINVDNSGIVKFDAFTANAIEVEAETAGNVSGVVYADEIVAEAETGGSITLIGRCKEVEAEAETGGTINLRALVAERGKLGAETGARILSPTGGSYEKETETGGIIE